MKLRGALVAACTLAALAASAPGRMVAVARAAPARGAAKSAPTGVRIEASVDRPIVGVGDVLAYEIKITTSVALPGVSAARPGKIDGFTMLGRPFTATGSRIVMNGSTIEQISTIATTFHLRADALGAHALGPGSVQIGGVTYEVPATNVTVVEAGRAPAPKRTRPVDPFDLDDDDLAPPEPPAPKEQEPADPLAKVDAPPSNPRDRDLFLRVVVDPGKLVVGAQATAKVFVYARRRARITVKRPPVFADFATIDLGQPDRDWHPITIAGDDWAYAAVAAYAIFPLKTGTLTVGSSEIEALETDAFGMRGLEQDHASEPVALEVTEPPEQGRPADYRLGDVASDLVASAEVSPRVTPDGHAVVTVHMAGTGRLEHVEPLMPTVSGLTWSKTSDETKTVTDGLRVRSRREVVYDAAATRTGDFSLGDARVIVWDPARSTYVTAKAPLGTLRANAAAPVAAPSTSAEPKLELPPPRTEPGARGDGTTIADRGWTWGLVAGAPLLVLAAQGAARAAGAMKKRSVAQREDPNTRAKEALREARDRDAKGDAKGAAAARVRAIELAIEASTEGAVRARGMTGAELRTRLADEGFDVRLADRAADALGALEAARFAGEPGPTTDDVAAIVDAIANARRAP